MKTLRILGGLAVIVIAWSAGSVVAAAEVSLRIEEMLEAESPAYKALTDKQRVALGNNPIVFNTQYLERMQINGAGSVGIGGLRTAGGRASW